MNLGEYIATYRRGNAALTIAEATIMGFDWPLPSKWFKKHRLDLVDHLAMSAAMTERRAVVANKKAKGESKKAKAAARRNPASVQCEAVVIAVRVVVATHRPAVDIPSDRINYINSKAFLDSFEWRQLRFKALQKYGRRCQCCGSSPSTGAVLNVDHVKPRRKFPGLALDISNLQVLCADCNHGKGNAVTDFR